MRTLDRNKQLIYISLYEGREEITDRNGNLTGEYTQSYSEPMKYYISYAQESGVTELEGFGQANNSTLHLVTCDMKCPIDEHTRLWIDKEPDESLNGKDYNFVVIGRFKGLQSIKFTAQRVDV
ncbi:MAG: hypothetical protein LUD47_06800 [Clostridia bacterium]|nr:hypothetical protein [Clostridia bacterium]